MLVMGHPQFKAQDDDGIGDGIPPIPEWRLDAHDADQSNDWLGGASIDSDLMSVFSRLCNIFQRAQSISLTSTRLHDLICFVLHRLLLPLSETTPRHGSAATECIRYATVLYLFIIQGPTYYTHAVLFNTIISRLVENLNCSESLPGTESSLTVWLLTVGLVASNGTVHHDWFTQQIRDLASSLQISHWEDALLHMRQLLWLDTPHVVSLFRPHWDAAVNTACPLPIQHHQPELTKYDLLG